MAGGDFNGKGVISKSNGNRYAGAWKDDKKQGHGLYSRVCAALCISYHVIVILSYLRLQS